MSYSCEAGFSEVAIIKSKFQAKSGTRNECDSIKSDSKV
jgi:hypothetical protein